MATDTKTSIKKWICAASNFMNCTYSILFNLLNVGNFFWSWILKDCIKEKRKLLSFVPVLDKTWNLAVSRCSHATTAEKRTKKRVACCYFACQNLLLFCHSRCRRRCINSLMLRRRSGSTTKHTCVACSNCMDLVQCGDACNKQQATDEKTTANCQDSVATYKIKLMIWSSHQSMGMTPFCM